MVLVPDDQAGPEPCRPRRCRRSPSCRRTRWALDRATSKPASMAASAISAISAIASAVPPSETVNVGPIIDGDDTPDVPPANSVAWVSTVDASAYTAIGSMRNVARRSSPPPHPTNPPNPTSAPRSPGVARCACSTPAPAHSARPCSLVLGDGRHRAASWRPSFTSRPPMTSAQRAARSRGNRRC